VKHVKMFIDCVISEVSCMLTKLWTTELVIPHLRIVRCLDVQVKTLSVVNLQQTYMMFNVIESDERRPGVYNKYSSCS